VLAKLAHPNLLYAIDAGKHEEQLYLVTEYIDGIDLLQLVRKQGTLSLADACEIARQMCLGLSVAHSAQIVHRDIKPSNVMIGRNGQVKVLDLGLASIHDDTSQSLTDLRTALGTPEYMPPEQWRGSHLVTSASDIYSLGCTLYFLLAGEPPFSAKAYPTLPMMMVAHLEGKPTDLRHHFPEVDMELSSLGTRCLSKKASQRPLYCKEIEALLAPYCGESNLRSLASEALPPAEYGSNESDLNPQMLGSDSSTLALPEENVTWSRVKELEIKWNLPFLLVTLTVLLLSVASPALAYFGPSTTETWTRRFDRLQDSSVPAGTEFLIEVVRAILFTFSASAVCFLRFGEPLKRFFSPRLNAPAVWIARIVVLLLVSFFLRAEINRHWFTSESGMDMVRWRPRMRLKQRPRKKSFHIDGT